jgi:hypothetical protein
MVVAAVVASTTAETPVMPAVWRAWLIHVAMSWVVAPAMVIAAVLFDPTLIVMHVAGGRTGVLHVVQAGVVRWCRLALSTRSPTPLALLAMALDAEGVARLELKRAALVEAGRDAQHVELGIQLVHLSLHRIAGLAGDA